MDLYFNLPTAKVSLLNRRKLQSLAIYKALH